MPTASSNLSAILDLAGAAAVQDGNLLGKSARIANQIARGLMREARLSDQNQYLQFQTLSSPSKEQAIPTIADPNSIVTVELLVDATYDYRVDVQIVSRPELNAKDNSLACARFGRPTTMRFSWDPVRDSQSGLGFDTIYVGYEALPTLSESNLNYIPALPEDFHDVLVYRSAALVMETILSKTAGPVFMDTMKRFEQQWKEWIDRGAEERPVQKPGFGTLDAYFDPQGAIY